MAAGRITEDDDRLPDDQPPAQITQQEETNPPAAPDNVGNPDIEEELHPLEHNDYDSDHQRYADAEDDYYDLEGYPLDQYELESNPGDEDEPRLYGMRVVPDTLNETTRLNAMSTASRKEKYIASTPSVWEYDNSVRRTARSGPPIREKRFQQTLTRMMKINGVDALVLFDSGCTTDSITPNFAYVAKMQTVKLTESVALQLGTTGSRTKINYGVRGNLAGEGRNFDPEYYFDVVNLDTYDVVLGTPFLTRFKVSLDFVRGEIHFSASQNGSSTIPSTSWPSLTWGEGENTAKATSSRRPPRTQQSLAAAQIRGEKNTSA